MHFLTIVVRNVLILLSMNFLLAACSVFSPIKTDMTEFVLTTVPHSVTKKASHRITLMVAEPKASSIYDTTEMAYSTKRYQLAYFSKNRWADSPPQMLQPLIVDALQRTHYFHAVGTASALGNYDFRLNTQLLELKQVFYQNSPSEVHLKEFAVVENAPHNTPYGGVIAANRATSRMLTELTRWCLNLHLNPRVPHLKPIEPFQPVTQ
jgi:cholesterol transport system auxiliary component